MQRTPLSRDAAISITAGSALLLVALLGACGARPDSPRAETPPRGDPPSVKQPSPTKAEEARPATSGLREVFPHVRADAQARIVEFDGIVPIDAHDADAPLVYLEVVACTQDSKEHESLVMTQAKPSHVHAALLLIDLKPGTPGRWTMEGGELRPVPPTGDPVEVTISYRDAAGKAVTVSPSEWIVDVATGERFDKPDAGGAAPGWLFAGSQMVHRQGREWYDADGAGTLIGLTTFGSETIAYARVISPDASIQEPEWIASKERVPPVGTPVTVRIKPRAPAK